MDDEPIKIVPQANSWNTFDAIFDLVSRGTNQNDAIAEEMEMTPRAVAYYIQLGEWLGFFERGELSATGHRYRLDAHDKKLAGERMASYGWFADALEAEMLETGLRDVLGRRSGLSDATIARRVSGLVRLWEDRCGFDATIGSAGDGEEDDDRL